VRITFAHKENLFCLFVFIMALSSSHYNNLREILRRANAHYSRIAATIRLSIRSTHHARKRATALKLTVSIEKALKLDPKQISTVPPPVIDRAISPPFKDLSRTVVGRERELARALSSRWSMSPTEVDSVVVKELQEILKRPPQLYLLPPRDLNNHLNVPPLSWVSDISSLGSLSSGSASNTSSRGPRTPPNADSANKHTIRIKRKSSEIDDNMLEKRPKYDQNEWTILNRRIVQRKIPVHSGRF